jgi:hypothetical protein
MANLVPPGISLEGWGGGPTLLLEFVRLSALEQKEWVHREFPGQECRALRRHLLSPRTAGTLMKRISRLMAITQTVRAIVRMKKTRGANVPLASPTEVTRLDERGCIEFRDGELKQALDGVEAARIRECPVCMRVFWAKRKDKQACSERCVNARRVREWRKNYRAKYKLLRIRSADKKESG